MKRILSFIFALSVCSGISQNGFSTYTTNLSIPGVARQTAFLIDNSGNKWIGFRHLSGGTIGLVKYDNTTWTAFSTTTTPALPSKYVTALAKDNSGNIWIGTDSGLVKYDGITFTLYNMANGLPAKLVKCIEVVGSQVYIGTNAGLSRFDGMTFTNYNVSNGKLPSDTITCIKAENPNLFWLGGKNRMVEFTINSGLTITNFMDHNIPSSFFNQYTANSPGNINCIYIDSQNDKWLGTTNCGIVKYDGVTFANAFKLYDLFGSSFPQTVLDIATGLNNGIIFRHLSSSSSSVYNGLTELSPGNMIYQYFLPSTTTTTYSFGEYIENDGSDILVSQFGISFNSASPKMYYGFNKTNYIVPFDKVNSNNFKTLDINNVRAGLSNRSDMHWDMGGQGNALYEVPKGKGINSSFASALWIGGLDAGGQLHGGAQTYRQNGVDFWPGPLDTISATIDTLTSYNYDKIWKVSYTDINTFITAFNSGSVVATPDMLTWPAHGSGNNARYLAPFVDHNGDGMYDPYTGDYPKIKGDQALYFIYNDKLATHSTSYTPMGIEVQGMAYAYGCPAVVNGHNELTYTTFYDYKIINRSSIGYHDVYVSMWTDADLGTYSDDYIGCNVADNYGFIYNGDVNDDTSFGVQGYGAYIPAQGYNVVKGPLADALDGIDNNNNGIIDEPNEDCKLNKFTFFNNALPGFPAATVDPQTSAEYYGYMTGYWKDGAPFTCGGNAYGGTTNTNWAYPGDPNNAGVNTDPNNTCGYWIENAIPGDRRMILGSGPFTLNPGQMKEVEYAFVTSFDSSVVNDNLISLAKLKTDIQKVNTFYNQLNKPNCLQAITVGVTESLRQTDLMLYPNPAKSVIAIQSTIEGPVEIDYEIVDVLGKAVLQNQHYNNSFSVNVSELKPGIYFIRLSINNSLVVKKFVKE